MVTTSRTLSGLAYRSDGTLAGWTGSGWASAAEPRYVCWPTGGPALLGPDAASGCADGFREPQLYVESGVWYLLGDGGDGATGWVQHLARSSDGGRTWERKRQPIGLASGGTGPAPKALATGWLEKRGSSYYLHRVLGGDTFAAPNVGLTNLPFTWDCWQTADLWAGPWVPATGLPGTGRYAVGGAFSSEFLPGSVVLSGGSYYAFPQGGTGAGYRLGVCAGAAGPGGPFVAPAGYFADVTTAGFGSRNPENPKVFYSAALGRWVCLANLIAADGTHTDANGVGYSASLTDWSAAAWHRTQRLCPLDGQLAVGVACHVTGPDGALVIGPGGEVPVTYDANPRRFSPGWHLGREALPAVLEPCPVSLKSSGSGAVRRTLSIPDGGAAEWVVEFGGSGTCDLSYGTDGSGSGGYAVRLSTSGAVSLRRNGSSVATGGAAAERDFTHRLRLKRTGARHQVWCDGEAVIDYTDGSPLADGGSLGLVASAANCSVRQLGVYGSDALTVTGLTPGSGVRVLAAGGLPAGTGIADATGTARVTLTHWPAVSLAVGEAAPDATAYPLWGGDSVRVTYPGAVVPPAPAAVAPAARW